MSSRRAYVVFADDLGRVVVDADGRLCAEERETDCLGQPSYRKLYTLSQDYAQIAKRDAVLLACIEDLVARLEASEAGAVKRAEIAVSAEGAAESALRAMCARENEHLYTVGTAIHVSPGGYRFLGEFFEAYRQQMNDNEKKKDGNDG